MKTSERGRSFIKQFEQCRLKAYRNSLDEPWTIGWGNTVYENGKPVKQHDVITQEKADRLFDFWLGAFERDVEQLVTSDINQNQFDALVSFAYNCGSDIDADTKAEGLGDSTLLKKVNSNPADPSIRNEFMKWISKGTVFENGLRKRRKREADIYFE